MTDDQIEKLAELVFQKLLAKQDEWENEFYGKADKDFLISEIVRLNIVKMEFVENENYEMASKTQKEINRIRETLNKES
jgi:UDP-2,3-diacylglucosamine pyrophosphatase LpxH